MTYDHPILIKLMDKGFSKNAIEEAIVNELSIEYEKLVANLMEGML